MRTLVAVTIVGVLFVGCAEEAPPEPWIVQELGSHADFRDVFFLDAQRGWIVGGGHDIGGGILGSTTDGGRTWSFKSAIVPPPRRALSFHLNAVWFIDERTGFIVGDGFHILRTVDGGKHWHRMSPARGRAAHLLDLQFVDDRHGWAIGPGGLARTIDGGETWCGPLVADVDEKPVRYTRGLALSFVDRQRGWLAGKAGMIRSTADGGESWTRIAGSEAWGSPDLWGLDFADEHHGWAVGERGAILHTTDGGKTWYRQSSGVGDTLMDVDFIDASHGWAVGFERATGSAVVLQTTDAGTTWTEQARVRSEAMRDVFAMDASHAWAVGEQQRRGSDDRSQKLLRYEEVEPER